MRRWKVLSRTVEIRELVEDGWLLFDFPYPIFNEDHRPILERKILDHYWFRDIAYDAPGHFQKRLQTKMNEIMPHANERYLTTLIEFNPFITESIGEKSHTKHGQKRSTGYGSAFSSEQSNNERSSSMADHSAQQDSEKDTTGNVKGVSRETYEDDGTINKVGSVLYDEDTQVDTDKSTDTDSVTKSDGTSNTKDTSTQTTIGHSNKDVTNHSNTVVDSKRRDDDTPQSSLNFDGNPLDDGYASMVSYEKGTTVVDSNGNEVIDSNETISKNGNVDAATHDTTIGEVNTTEDTLQTGKKESTTNSIEDTVSHNEGIKNSETSTDTTGNEVGVIHSSSKDKESSQNKSDTNSKSLITSLEDRDLKSKTIYGLELVGFRGISPQELLIKLRESFIDVDLEVINYLEPLFLQIF